jgi:thioredoxin-related protein
MMFAVKTLDFIASAFVALSTAAPAQEILKTSPAQQVTWHGDIATALMFKSVDCKYTERMKKN